MTFGQTLQEVREQAMQISGLDSFQQVEQVRALGGSVRISGEQGISGSRGMDEGENSHRLDTSSRWLGQVGLHNLQLEI